jgi:hypothetical protein
MISSNLLWGYHLLLQPDRYLFLYFESYECPGRNNDLLGLSRSIPRFAGLTALSMSKGRSDWTFYGVNQILSK